MKDICYRGALRSLTEIFILFTLIPFSYGQADYQDREVRVHHLRALMAVSSDPAVVLATSLYTILDNKDVCCGRDSAMEDSLMAADPASLKDVARKLEGKHRLSDGRPIKVTTEYLPRDQANGGHLIQMIHDQHPALMQWKANLYVVHGAVYYLAANDTGGTYAALRRLLLWDTRYSDARRQVTFTIGTDDISMIDGFLFVNAALQ